MQGLAVGLDWRGASGRGAFLAALVLWTALFLGTGLVPPFSPAATVLWPLAGIALMLVFGMARRRLRALGASGWWLWLLLVPFVSLVFAFFLVLRRGDPDAAPGAFSRPGQIGVALLGLFLASRATWEPYAIPAGSMKPALRVGDYIVVTPARGALQRGDVVVFAHPTRGTTFVKRILALPGETVGLTAGIPVIDGASLRQTTDGIFTEVFDSAVSPQPRCANAPVADGGTCDKARYAETTPEGRTYAILDIGDGPADSVPARRVPEGHVFVMGDNRDNSLDSRAPARLGGVGMLPVENIHGVARRVVFNAEGLPGRVFRRIE